MTFGGAGCVMGEGIEKSRSIWAVGVECVDPTHCSREPVGVSVAHAGCLITVVFGRLGWSLSSEAQYWYARLRISHNNEIVSPSSTPISGLRLRKSPSLRYTGSSTI